MSTVIFDGKLQRARNEVRNQLAWIRRCGGDLDGYIANYGSRSDPNHSGDGAEAIYKADTDELAQMYERLAALLRGADNELFTAVFASVKES